MRTWCTACYPIATALVVLACDRGGGARGVSAGGATRPEASASAAPSPRHGERWPEAATASARDFTTGSVDFRQPPRAVALLTDVRAARHEGFDRVVFELGSGAPPGFHLEYVDQPVRKCGSGEATPIAGDAWLEVRLDPANAHTTSGAPTIANRNQTIDLQVVKELEQTCDFEAVVSWVIGLHKPSRYRVLTLNDPLRLVVDLEP